MREVRVESVEEIALLGDEVRLLANDGDLGIVFPMAVWTQTLASTSDTEEPTPEELRELEKLKGELLDYARSNRFRTILEDVQCGGSNLTYDLVLQPGGLFAATTGYHFAPVVAPDLMARIGVNLEEDEFVEQAYVVGAVTDPVALAAGDEALRALSIRGRQCSASRFEMAPELWRVLSERLGWKNVETSATEKR